jgi:hypothetical protein
MHKESRITGATPTISPGSAKTRSFLDRRLYLKVETYSDGQVKAGER